jgi:hypothetical protein
MKKKTGGEKSRGTVSLRKKIADLKLQVLSD